MIWTPLILEFDETRKLEDIFYMNIRCMKAIFVFAY